MPAPMRPALSTFPLLPGSRWRWRVTGRYEGVKWSAWTAEEVVEAGWILADDRIVVRSRRSGEWLSGDPLGMEERPRIVTVWRTIHADGVVESAADAGLAGPSQMFVGCCSPADIAVFLDPGPDPTERTSWVIDHQTAAHQTVVTAAGRFDDCATFYTVGGNGWGTFRAVCRGIGIVRGELAAETYTGSAIESMELVAYDVVLPR